MSNTRETTGPLPVRRLDDDLTPWRTASELPATAPAGGREVADLPPAKRKTSIWFVLTCVLVGLIGAAAGLYAGIPGLVERAGKRALVRLEDRFGVRIDAAEVAWTWGGNIRARGVVVRLADGRADDEVLATVDTLEVDSEVDFWERHVRVLRVAFEHPVMKVTRDAAGHSNLDSLIAAAKKLGDAKAGSGVGGGITIAPELPIVVMDGATLALDAVLPALPFGLTLPGKATFENGKVTLRPTGPSPDGHVATTPLRVEVAFASTSLDPGQGLAFVAEGPLSGPPTRLEVRPARPMRFWLQERVLGVGGIALTADGIELGPLQLSVPIGKQGGATEVAAAASCEKVIVSPSPTELLARVVSALGPDGGAREPSAAGKKAMVTAAIGALDEVKLVRPVVSVTIDAAGHHDFEDLLPPLGPGLATSPLATTSVDFVRALTDANLAASDRLLARPGKSAKAGATGTLPPRPLWARVAAPFEALDRMSRRRVPTLVRAFMPLVLKRLVVENGELLIGVPGAQMTLAGVSVDATHVGELREIKASIASVDFGVGDKPSLSVVARLDGSRLHCEVNASAVPLSLLSALQPEEVPTGAAAPKVAPLLAPVGQLRDIALTFDGDVQGVAWELGGKASLEGGVLTHASLAQNSLTDLALQVQGTLRWDATAGRLTVADGVVQSHGLLVHASLDIADAQRRPKVHVQLDLPETPVQRIVDALPKGFAPLLRGLRIEGMLRWPVVVDLDTAAPEAVKVDSRPEGRGIQVMTLGDKVDFVELRASHTYSILLADGLPGQRMVGPATGSWVSLSDITPYLPLALTTTEDGTFYSNDGISTRAMLESIATNLERGAFVRGGSTLTQQLVKNLYLGGNKTVSRKLQEVFIAWQMAQQLSKEEVMALYLNTIEFGPGIYGIGDAAWHWFGKRPIDLTLTEAIMLASIIPGPRRYYSFFLQGAVTPRWQQYLEALLKIMVERGKITEQEFLAAAPYVPAFRGAGGGYHDSEPPADFDEIPENDDGHEEPD